MPKGANSATTVNYRKYLREAYHDSLELYKKDRQVGDIVSFDEVKLPTTMPDGRLNQLDWQRFLGDAGICPLTAIEIYGPRRSFQEFVGERRKLNVADLADLKMPVPQADWHDCMAAKSSLLWEFTSRNYSQVLEYLWKHGRGIPNAVFYEKLRLNAPTFSRR